MPDGVGEGGHCVGNGVNVGPCRGGGGWRDPGQGKRVEATSLAGAERAGRGIPGGPRAGTRLRWCLRPQGTGSCLWGC